MYFGFRLAMRKLESGNTSTIDIWKGRLEDIKDQLLELKHMVCKVFFYYVDVNPLLCLLHLLLNFY